MGMRAITLEINEFSGVAGFVQAGCHVDILQTLRDEKSGNPIARTIAQNVKVTAIGIRHVADGNADSNNGGGGRSATLLVTPAQAEVLELASMSGRPRLTLRGSNDLAPAWTKGISLNELVGDSKADTTPKIFLPTTQPTVQATTRPYDNDQWTMEIVRGAAQTSVKFTIPKGESESKIDFNK
jgi:Flp pilus assembly protein CpaB